MYLKKYYDSKSLEAGAPKITHVSVLRLSDPWRPSTKIVARGQAEGWLKLDPEKLTISLIIGDADGPYPEPMVYKIVAPPGRYCCHCGEPLASAAAASKHLAAKHKGAKSPDSGNPSGYARHNFFMCELAAES